MPSQLLTGVLRYIRALDTANADGERDAALLRRFIASRDEGAFAALLRRHGPLVFGVCRQVLRDSHDAEDAFQATFLILARKAGAIRSHGSLAGWLHRVALNVAQTAKASAELRRSHERQAVLMAQASPADDLGLPDWQPLVHEEVDRLPDKYRVAVVLCYFEGKSHGEAAGELGWPLGTVKGRLARARDLLRTRLARRGLVLSASAVATTLTQSAVVAHMPIALCGVTLRAAVSFAAGETIPAGTTSAQAVALAKGALSTMTSTRLLAVLILIVSAAVVATLSFVAGMPGDRPEARSPAADQPAPKPEAEADPLPADAVARMGSPRFRHGGPVLSMAYLADGKVLATGGPIGTRRETGMGRIRLWDTATGKELRQFQLKGDANLAGSPDGKILAGADERDGIVYLWDAATGKEIRTLKGSTGPQAIAFSGDGKKLATGGHYVRIWEVETGKLLHTAEHDESAIALAFSADGKILAVQYIDLRPLRLFQVDPWKELAALGKSYLIDRFALSPDNRTLAVTKRGEAWIHPVPPEMLRARGAISLHDATDGTALRQFQAHQFVDPLGQDTVNALVFSPDGKTLASAASDKAIRLWDVATGKERQAFPADSFASGSLAFTPDGKSLAWASSAGLIRIWDLQTGKAAHRHEGHQGGITSVALTPDSKTLITAGADATIRLWETTSGKELRRFEGHEGPIASIHLSKDGKTLASVSPANKTVRVWEVSTGKQLQRFRASDTYCDAAWLPDSRTLVIRRYLDDFSATFYDVVTGKETRRIDKLARHGMYYPANVEGAHQGGVLAVSPDGKMLVTSINFQSPTFQLWDTATGKELPGLWPDPSHQPIVMTAEFSADGKALVTGTSSPTTIQVWDLATRKERQHFASHFKVKDPDGEEIEVPVYLAITYLAMSPNGRTMATASWDPTIRLWDVATGKERGRLEGHRGTVTSLAWSADGKTLVSGSNDGTALVWKVAE